MVEYQPRHEYRGTGAIITPESLLRDNSSRLADQLRTEWFTAKKMGALLAFHGCADARADDFVASGGLPGILSLRSIAAAEIGNKRKKGGIETGGDPFSFVYEYPGLQGSIVAEHYSSEKFEESGIPSGCGGLEEKKKAGNQIQRVDIARNPLEYVLSRITHNDPTVQAIVSASKIAKLSPKPVLAALLDHLSYEFYPVALIQGDMMISPIGLQDLLNYNPVALYEKGIPMLDPSVIPHVFNGFIRGNKEQQMRFAQNPGFSESQRVQNPLAIMISTEIRPGSMRLPKTFEFPNSVFCVRLPFRKSEGGPLSIDSAALQETIAQASYALSHAASSQPGGSFFDTNTLLIETPDMGLTKEVMQEVLRSEPARAWRRQKNGNVIYAQVNEAQTKLIDSL